MEMINCCYNHIYNTFISEQNKFEVPDKWTLVFKKYDIFEKSVVDVTSVSRDYFFSIAPTYRINFNVWTIKK